MLWFVEFAESIGSRAIEFHYLHLAEAESRTLAVIGEKLLANSIEPVISGPWPLTRILEAVPLAKQLGVRTLRTHLTPVLCGARAAQGDKWSEMVSEIRINLAELGPKCVDLGLMLAIENHQDFGSEEMLEFCEIGGPGVGMCLDTGNPLAVCEDPVAFAKRVAHKVRHIHLKDYRAQATPEGFRLVRCPIGDGTIPLAEIGDVLMSAQTDLTATLEPGALHARHIELLTDAWWQGYGTTPETISEVCLAAIKRNAILANEEWRTPLESGADAEAICTFEMNQMMKSVKNMQSLGWLSA